MNSRKPRLTLRYCPHVDGYTLLKRVTYLGREMLMPTFLFASEVVKHGGIAEYHSYLLEQGWTTLADSLEMALES